MRLLLILALLCSAPALGAQGCDSTTVSIARVRADSVLKTHLSERTQRAITMYQRRNVQWLVDALARICLTPIVRSVGVGFDLITSSVWPPPGRPMVFPSGFGGKQPTPNDSVTVCATVQKGTVMHLGSSAVRVWYISDDSVRFSELPARDSTLRALCRPNWAHASEQSGGYGPIINAPIYPVMWESVRLELPNRLPLFYPTAKPVPQQ